MECQGVNIYLRVMAVKWRNKGHEFDALAVEYKEKFQNKVVFIFGAGEMGAVYAKVLLHFGLLRGFIDNNKEKLGRFYCGQKVISLDDYLALTNEDAMIVVCVNMEHSREIVTQLLEKGLREGKDFVRHTEYCNTIFPILLAYDRNQVFLPLVQISVTERCTLKCKKCAHACNLVPYDADDLSFEKVCHSADRLFSFVEYVQEFVLIGGEPFLYKALEDAIIYIGKKYRDKINIFSITTNGTVTPLNEVLKTCKQYGVLIRISNYSKTLPRLNSHYDKLTAALGQYEIPYILGDKDAVWMDYGFEYVNRGGNSEQLTAVFDKCKTPCHEVRGDRFYFCVMARSVAENMRKDVGINDYFDMQQYKPGIDNKVFLEYIMGYSDKGYLDMCNYCHGGDTPKYPIPAAEQM